MQKRRYCVHLKDDTANTGATVRTNRAEENRLAGGDALQCARDPYAA